MDDKLKDFLDQNYDLTQHELDLINSIMLIDPEKKYCLMYSRYYNEEQMCCVCNVYFNDSYDLYGSCAMCHKNVCKYHNSLEYTLIRSYSSICQCNKSYFNHHDDYVSVCDNCIAMNMAFICCEKHKDQFKKYDFETDQEIFQEIKNKYALTKEK